MTQRGQSAPGAALHAKSNGLSHWLEKGESAQFKTLNAPIGIWCPVKWLDARSTAVTDYNANVLNVFCALLTSAY